LLPIGFIHAFSATPKYAHKENISVSFDDFSVSFHYLRFITILLQLKI